MTGIEYAKILQKIGGKEWINGDKHRIYFNDFCDRFGVEFETFKSSGRVCWVTIDGEKVSNSTGQEVLNALHSGMLFYDVVAKQFVASFSNTRLYDAETFAHFLIDSIKDEAEGKTVKP